MPVKIDQQSFLQAYDELADALFRHCFFRLYDREKARDAVQEVFLRAWDYMSSGGEVKNIKAFLFQTARNYIIDEHRKALLRRHPSLDEIKETGQEPGHDPRTQLDARVDASRLLDLCSEIEPSYRDVLVWRYVDGLLPRDIAKLTGESTNVISVRLHRAIKRLQSILPDYEPQA